MISRLPAYPSQANFQPLTKPRLHFGASASGLPSALAALAPTIPNLRDFWQGRVPLVDQRGQTVLAEIQPAQPWDADVVHRWYSSRQTDKPVYEDRKWHDWWLEKIRQPDAGCRTFKLEANGELLGVLYLENRVNSFYSGKPITLLRGLRVAPGQYGRHRTPDSLKGIGSSLVTFAVGEALRRKNAGIGLNSSVGVEGFYQKLLGPSPCKAFDGQRDYFELTDETLRAFLQKQYGQYQARLDANPSR